MGQVGEWGTKGSPELSVIDVPPPLPIELVAGQNRGGSTSQVLSLGGRLGLHLREVKQVGTPETPQERWRCGWRGEHSLPNCSV